MASHQLETSCKQNTDTRRSWRCTEFPPVPGRLCISDLYVACFKLKIRASHQTLLRYSSVPSQQQRNSDLELDDDHFHSTQFPCHRFIQYFYFKLQAAKLNTPKLIEQILSTSSVCNHKQKPSHKYRCKKRETRPQILGSIAVT